MPPVSRRSGVSSSMPRHQLDAVDRARRQAQLAAGAVLREHGVHHVRYADDRVDRTGARAEIAADAERLVDTRNPLHARVAEAGIERARIAAKELGERTNRRLAPGRAAVDVCVAFEDRLGIRPTPRIAA